MTSFWVTKGIGLLWAIGIERRHRWWEVVLWAMSIIRYFICRILLSSLGPFLTSLRVQRRRSLRWIVADLRMIRTTGLPSAGCIPNAVLLRSKFHPGLQISSSVNRFFSWGEVNRWIQLSDFAKFAKDQCPLILIFSLLIK